MSDAGVDDGLDPALEKEARDMGWKPEAEFKGKKENWVDAETYVERGRSIAPILRHNNETLRKDLLTQKQKNDILEKQVAELRTQMEEFQAGASSKQLEAKKAQLLEQLKAARQDDDVEAEYKIREQLDALKPEPPKKKQEPAKGEDDGLSPEFKAWNAENPWFGGTSSEDKKKTKEVYRIAEDMREEGTRLTGAEFMDAAVAEYEKRQRKARGEEDEPSDKHEPGYNGGRQSGSKGFNSLPRAAKEACWEDNEKFVGEGKLFKTQKDWEAHYYEQYTNG